MAHSAQKGKLLAIIGDEVNTFYCKSLQHLSFAMLLKYCIILILNLKLILGHCDWILVRWYRWNQQE